MSTSFYLACDKHKTIVFAGERGILGGAFLSNTFAPKLAAFVISHRNCQLHVLEEGATVLDSLIPGYGDGVWSEWNADEINDDLFYGVA